MRYRTCLLAAATLAAACAAPSEGPSKSGSDDVLVLHTRSRDASEPDRVREEVVEWDPHTTAIVVVDMWDDHWCASAARRVDELAGPMNDMLATLRDRGAFVVHAPSSVVDAYEGTVGRDRATSARFASAPVPLAAERRWGTTWCWPDEEREPDLPIDDSDMGCDCPTKCEIREAWTRQNSKIEIHDYDAVTDDGQELYNLLAEREIDHVLVAGVHLNMCVLGRPVGIRQLVNVGKDVLLVRDMTDTMYDPRRPPHVDHFTGTDRVVEHVERYWCPTIASSDLTGAPPFRFADDPR